MIGLTPEFFHMSTKMAVFCETSGAQMRHIHSFAYVYDANFGQ